MVDWLKDLVQRTGLSQTDLFEQAADETIAVLCVDDHAVNLDILKRLLSPFGWSVITTESGYEALRLAAEQKPIVALLDIDMPQMDGFELCRRLKENPETQQIAVIFCSNHTDTESIVRGLQLGAVDYITKPYARDEVLARVMTHLATQLLASSLKRSNEALQKELSLANAHHAEAHRRLDWALMGPSRSIRHVKEMAEEVAPSADPVLVYGMPSTGHESLARDIHRLSPRKDQAFLLMDCSQRREQVLQSDDPQSIWMLSDGGTLFLEGLQALSSSEQDDLADYLHASGDLRLAGGRPIPDVRIIASATLDSNELLNRFSADLKKILSQNVLRLPQLMERREDILPIAEKLLNRQALTTGKVARGFTEDSKERLREHLWPGNLRELEDVIVRSLSTSHSATISVDPSLLEIGVPLGGYRLIEKLGEGGMGEVWQAKHQLLARPAAIKLVRQDRSERQILVERFEREAKMTSRMVSPHTVTLFDFGVSENGSLYYVMELLDGMDLKRLSVNFGPIPPERVAHFLVQACKSLAESHEAGLIHRDIKPSNLFTCRMGCEVDILKVLDFGLVTQHNSAKDQQLTASGTFTGTAEYAAPEAVTSGEEITGAIDIYSIGVTAYQLLCGKLPFDADDPMKMLLKQINEKPVPIRDLVAVPKPMAKLVMRCLSKVPSVRPSAVELWDKLEKTKLPQKWTQKLAAQWWRDNT